MTNIILGTNNNQTVANSRQIAQHFEKRHDNVLRDIDNLKKHLLNSGEYFYETTMPDSYGRQQRVYLMNRNGFTLLTMGFTGKKALQFKLAYINAFNEMEQLDPIERAKLWIVQQERLREIGSSISR